MKLISKFWWALRDQNRPTHWVKHDRLHMQKEMGGLNFCDRKLMNLAFLSKQIGRLIDCPDSLVSKLLKARYYKGYNVLSALQPLLM